MTYKSCFDGYLTPECASCDFWMDGKDPENGFAVGCGTIYPIDWCRAFRKMIEEKEKQQ